MVEEVYRCEGRKHHSRRAGGLRRDLYKIRGQFCALSGVARRMEIPGARPASSRTRRPSRGGRVSCSGIACASMYFEVYTSTFHSLREMNISVSQCLNIISNARSHPVFKKLSFISGVQCGGRAGKVPRLYLLLPASIFPSLTYSASTLQKYQHFFCADWLYPHQTTKDLRLAILKMAPFKKSSCIQPRHSLAGEPVLYSKRLDICTA